MSDEHDPMRDEFERTVTAKIDRPKPTRGRRSIDSRTERVFRPVGATGAYLASITALAGVAPMTWVIPSLVGTLASIGFVCLLLVASLATWRTPRVKSVSVSLFGLYVVAYTAQFLATGTIGFLWNGLLSALLVGTLVLAAPFLVLSDPTTYARTLTVIVSGLAIIGFALLGLAHFVGVSTPWTGQPALAGFPVMITSVFDNPNNFGFVTAIGTLSSVYLYLETRSRRWATVTIVLAIALLFSGSAASLVGCAIGTTTLLIYENRRIGLTVLSVALVCAVAVALLQSFDIYALVDSSMSFSRRTELWNIGWREATADPFVGGDTPDPDPHNLYVYALIRVGFVAGSLYLLAIGSVLVSGAEKAVRGDRWDAYVFATFLSICVWGVFESTMIGGIPGFAVNGLLFGLYAGFIVQLPAGAERRYTRH